MDAQSALKVIAAGFVIIRAEDQPLIRIKYKGRGKHEWSTMAKFESKAAHDREMKRLLENKHIIQD